MSKLSETERKFLQLLHSDQEENINLALEIGKGIPELDIRLYAYHKLYEYCFGESVPELEAKHVIALELDPEGHTFRFPDPGFLRKVRLKLYGVMYEEPDAHNQDLPIHITFLRGLKILDLEDQLLNNLPKELERLTELEELYLEKNFLKDLPLEFANLQKLHTIDLSSNKLESMPEVITKMKPLERLNLSRNTIKMLSAEIAKLKKLSHLILSHTHLTQLPQGINQLEALTYMDLSYASFTSFPEGVTELRNLKTLRLQGNKILKIPKKIKQLKSLEKLYISQYSFWGREKLMIKWYLPKCKVVTKQCNPLRIRVERFPYQLKRFFGDLMFSLRVKMTKLFYKTKIPFLCRIADILDPYATLDLKEL
ncbi:hypothetical protein BKI52_20485 [marine bacterium AO1-C]|nr:hypothetical protein BKI52_20485 [marine bacterium AO1-C]